MKLYEYGLLRARARPIAFTAAAASIVALAIVAVTGLGYLWSRTPPYGFYYDLGVDILATSSIAHWLQNAADLKDALGWAGWGNRSAFAFAPMTSVAISVALAKFAGNDGIWAVKAVQVAQVFLSAASAFYLYYVLRRSVHWGLVASVVYALLCEQLLMIRGDLSFGFAAALAPLAFAVPMVLVRRFGLAALPLCGALLSLFSAYFTIEHLFLQGIPAYAFAVALAYDRVRRAAWLLWSGTGLAVLFATVAYVVFPTQASMALFSPSATVSVALAGGEFTNYQNSILALASLTMNELISNPRKEFGVGWLLFLTVPIGLILWTLAFAWVRKFRSAAFAWGERRMIVTGAICIVLSTGALIPGVGFLWWIVSQIPVLDNIRTPDRFIALGVVAVVVCAISQLQAMSERPRAAASAWIAVLLCALGLATFFVFRTFLGDTIALEEKEPYLGAIAAVAEARDNRVANLALVDKGSVFDTSLYGSPLPFNDFQGDLAQRYEGDGLGGAGLLARANVSTIVASPPWTPDSPLYGQSSIARAAFLKPLAGDATTVAAYGVDPVRGYVRGSDAACLFGGPGLLDHEVALADFRSTALDVDDAKCKRAVYADEAPVNIVLGGEMTYRWPAISLFPHSGVMRDVDYRLAFGRFLINYPWYRNSVDGDATIFGPAAVSLDPGYTGSSVFEISRAGEYAFAMHVVCHGLVSGRVQIDKRTFGYRCKPQSGFQWIVVRAGAMNSGLHSLTVIVDAIDEPVGALATTWKLAFDGAAMVARSTAVAPAIPSAFVFSASRLAQRSLPLRPSGSLTLVSSAGFDPVGPPKVNGGQQFLARVPDATAMYRWNGPAGKYRIWATAYDETQYPGTSYVAIALNSSRCCLAVTTSGSGKGTTMTAQGDAMLHDGSLIRVSVHGEANDVASIVQLLGVSVEPNPVSARLSDDRSRAVAEYDFLGRMRHLAPQVPTFGASPDPGHNKMENFNGLPVSAPITFDVNFPAGTSSSPTTLSVYGDYSSAPLRVRLACGGSSVEGSFLATSGELALPLAASGACRVTLQSAWATAYVFYLNVSRSIGHYDLAGSRWIAAGRYRVSRIAHDGALETAGTLRVDGRLAGDTLAIERSGYHAIAWDGASPEAYLVAFVPPEWSAVSAQPRVAQTASARWNVTVRTRSSIEAAVFPDGFWRLSGSGLNAVGHRCNLENTCFDDVAPGTYELVHVWPSYIKIGFAVTLLAWIFAIGALVFVQRRSANAPAA